MGPLFLNKVDVLLNHNPKLANTVFVLAHVMYHISINFTCIEVTDYSQDLAPGLSVIT